MDIWQGVEYLSSPEFLPYLGQVWIVELPHNNVGVFAYCGVHADYIGYPSDYKRESHSPYTLSYANSHRAPAFFKSSVICSVGFSCTGLIPAL